MPVLENRQHGLYCPAGDFYVDPWAPVERAIVTHAHADRALPGSHAYLTTRQSAPLLRTRVGPDAAIQVVDYGETVVMGSARVSLHPAGHILGSAQVRIEVAGEVWVVSGNYKLADDPTCAPFEPLRGHTFVTEATFGLPVFRWPPEAEVREAIHTWWRSNQDAGRASLLFAHPTGKAQRLLALLDASIGPIYVHGAIEPVNRIYREQGIPLAPATELNGEGQWSRSLVLAPLSAHGSAWERRFGTASTAFVSGWMRIRGTRRRRSLDRGFVLSDHADWPALLRAIDESRAESVWVTEGYRAPMVRWLEEHGRRALGVETRFEQAEP